MKKIFFIAGIILGAYALCNLLAWHALPKVPSAFEATRNPFRFRGFPEYVRESSTAGNPHSATVVLISNSQAYAGEYSSRYGYPNRLQKVLNETKAGGCTNWTVLNWSSDGMTSIEYIILAAKLRQERPDFVLAVTGYADYRAAHHHEGFSFCRTDVPRLATRWPIARQIPRSYWSRHFKVEDTLTAFFRDRLPITRFPEYFWSLMDFKFPGAQGLLYAPYLGYHPWELGGVKAITKPLNLPSGPAGELEFTYDASSREMLEEYLAQLKRLPSPVLVVSQPLRANRSDFRAHWQEAFQNDLSALAKKWQVDYLDLSEALPGEDFITSSHLNPNNHQRLGERLAAEISARLEAGN